MVKLSKLVLYIFCAGLIGNATSPWLWAGKVKTLKVPYQYSTIQSAVDAAKEGDTVLVYPGKYMENIIFRGPNITLKSAEGPAVTKISGGNLGLVMYFANRENLNMVVDGFKIVKGYTNDNGGAIYIANQSSPTIKNCIIKSNYAKKGAGICVIENSAPIIENCIIEKNTAKKQGAGIFVFNSSPSIQNNRIDWNTVLKNEKDISDGAGIFCAGDDSNPVITNNTIQNNHAEVWGGGIIITGCHATITDNIVSNNFAVWHGAGITIVHNNHLTQGSTLVQNNDISNNTVQKIGAGVYLENAVNVVVRENTISNNQVVPGGGYADRDAGGIYAYNTSGVIEYNTVSDNTSKYMAAMDITDGCKLTIEHNTITGNVAEQRWIIILTAGDNKFRYNTVTGNHLEDGAEGFGLLGGAVFVFQGNAELASNLIAENDGGLGGFQSTFSAVNNTIVNNNALLGGLSGGMIIYQSTVDTLANNIFSGNEGYHIYEYLSTFTVSYNNFNNNDRGILYKLKSDGSPSYYTSVQSFNALSYADNNFAVSPSFESASYALTEDSKLVDSGNDSVELPTFDVMGNDRISGNTVDIGAYEYQL